MQFQPLSSPSVVFIVAFFSLAWFLVGLLAGRVTGQAPAGAPAAKRTRTRARTGGDGERVELYVGNLPYDVRSRDLRQRFEALGKVASARIINNKLNGKSKGFGFVEIVGRADAEAAIKAMHGKDFKGRKIVVNEAKSRQRAD
jgi:RNA recognition motif-containing protein